MYLSIRCLRLPFESADELYIPDWPSNASGLESLFCAPQVPSSENPYYEPLGLQELIASVPDPSFGGQDLSTSIESHTNSNIGPSLYRSPFYHECLLPFGTYSTDRREEYGLESKAFPDQIEASSVSDAVFWEHLASEEQMAFILAHPGCLEPNSLAPPSVIPYDEQAYNSDFSFLDEWMDAPFQDAFLPSFLDSQYHGAAEQFYPF